MQTLKLHAQDMVGVGQKILEALNRPETMEVSRPSKLKKPLKRHMDDEDDEEVEPPLTYAQAWEELERLCKRKGHVIDSPLNWVRLQMGELEKRIKV